MYIWKISKYTKILLLQACFWRHSCKMHLSYLSQISENIQEYLQVCKYLKISRCIQIILPKYLKISENVWKYLSNPRFCRLLPCFRNAASEHASNIFFLRYLRVPKKISQKNISGISLGNIWRISLRNILKISLNISEYPKILILSDCYPASGISLAPYIQNIFHIYQNLSKKIIFGNVSKSLYNSIITTVLLV